MVYFSNASIGSDDMAAIPEDVIAMVRELRTKVEALEGQADEAAVMVPVYVHVPHAVYQTLRERAEELGRPAGELASLWLWRATREF